MNDKTLKIRIKLHSSGTSPESPSIDPDEYERRTETSTISDNSNSKHLSRILGLLGVTALLLAGVYLFSTNESDGPEKIAGGSAESPLKISNGSSPNSAPQKPVISHRALMLDDSAVHKSQGTDDRSTSRTRSESASIGFSSDKATVKAVTESVESSPHTANATAASTDQNISESEILTQKAAENAPLKDYAAAPIESEEDGSKVTMGSINSESDSLPSTRPEIHTEPNLAESASSQLPQVSRAQFTSGIKAREPIDNVKETYYSDGLRAKRLYYFTELRGMKGDSIVHRWDHQGRTVANVTFNISGDRWRVYSSKTLPLSMKGRWNVVVTDTSGNPLVTDSFVYD